MLGAIFQSAHTSLFSLGAARSIKARALISGSRFAAHGSWGATVQEEFFKAISAAQTKRPMN